MTMMPFGPWLPDSPAYGSTAAQQALGVIPTAYGYRPATSFGATASAITARGQGAISVRDLAGTIHNFCGDATKLYKLASDGLSWADVSRTAGGAYATPAAGWWDFCQFGSRLIAVNGVDAAQVFILGTSTNFTALGGSSPVATFCGTIRGFGVMCRISTAWNRVHWSALEDVTDWVASATTLSDIQDIPEGGAIMGFVGGEYGLVFQERQISRMVFEGPPTIFRFDKITNQLGVRTERSIAAYEGLAFFLADDGMYLLRGGVELEPIGTEKWDRFLETDIDSNYLYRHSSAIDPIRKIYCLGYPSTAAGSETPDSIFCYHWPTGKAALWRISHEIIFSGATQSGFTLDGLDTVNPSIDALNHSLDSRIWTGSGRLLLAGFNTSHQSGFFDGANLAATLETGEVEIFPGYNALVRAVRPLIEGIGGATPSISIKRRNLVTQSLTQDATVAMNTNGICTARSNGLYHRALLTIPAASSWAHAHGVKLVAVSRMGARFGGGGIGMAT